MIDDYLNLENNTILKSEIFLTFSLDGDMYCFPISRVREVMDVTNITRMPKAPPFMKGVINLRGNVVPVVDLRVEFEIEPKEIDVNSSIIIVDVDVQGETLTIGTLVDQVHEVIEIDGSNHEPPPSLGCRIDSSFIKSIARMNEQFIMILDLDYVLSSDQLMQLGNKESSEV